jgi:prolyl-tRNA editing enzyme YbaK/EbsC (Cys-tRNA(Pro) deacylase)
MRRRCPYELLPHERTESALAEAEVLGIPPADVAKTLVVTTPEGYLRAVLPASARIDLRKLREARGGGGKNTVHLASEEDLARVTTRSSSWARYRRSAEAAATRSSSTGAWPSATR